MSVGNVQVPMNCVLFTFITLSVCCMTTGVLACAWLVCLLSHMLA